MFDQGDDDGVKDAAFFGRGRATGQLQKGEVAEVHLAEHFVRQVQPADADLVRRAPADF